jgi:hypothetical protein
MAPFRHLLSQSQPFVWDDIMETAFKKSKEMIIALIVEGVAYFDVDLVTCLSPTTASRGWAGFFSRKLVPAQKWYPHAVQMDGGWCWQEDTSANRLSRITPP